MYYRDLMLEFFNTPHSERTHEQRKAAYQDSCDEKIRYWEGFRNRNPHIDPNTHVLDRVGTVNGVLRELRNFRESFEIE
jgi:hypothetical protein